MATPVFSDTFMRANSTTIGNGWSTLFVNPSDVQILSNYLQFVTANAGVAYQANTLTGRNNLSALFTGFITATSPDMEFSVSHDGSSRSAAVGLYLSLSNTALTLNDSGSGVLATYTHSFANNTNYFIRWDISPTYAMTVYVNTTGNPFTSGDIVLTHAAFTPTSVNGGNWAFGNRNGAAFQNYSIYSPMIPSGNTGGFFTATR